MKRKMFASTQLCVMLVRDLSENPTLCHALFSQTRLKGGCLPTAAATGTEVYHPQHNTEGRLLANTGTEAYHPQHNMPYARFAAHERMPCRSCLLCAIVDRCRPAPVIEHGGEGLGVEAGGGSHPVVGAWDAVEVAGVGEAVRLELLLDGV